MSSTPERHRLTLNNVRIHCVRYPGRGSPLVMLHSLSGNVRLFDGLIAAGLATDFELLIPDMRGRGESEAPLAGYSLEEGCADLIAQLDYFGLEQVALCGHSFGGLTAIYFAAHYPERVSQLVLLDAAAEMHPLAPVMVAAASARLDKLFPSLEAYRAMFRAAPFVNRWDDEMNGFIEADLHRPAPGVLTTSSRGYTAALAALHVYGKSNKDWRRYCAMVEQPALLIQATDSFMMGVPMVTTDCALETVRLMENGKHTYATGNHFTMLYGPGAKQVTSAIRSFLTEGPERRAGRAPQARLAHSTNSGW